MLVSRSDNVQAGREGGGEKEKGCSRVEWEGNVNGKEREKMKLL